MKRGLFPPCGEARSFSSPSSRRRFVSDVLCAPFAGETLGELARRGMLGELLPEVAALQGVSQPPEFHPEGDVFRHTALMLDRMVFPDELLGWSVLLHDVGKPASRSVERSGRIRFFSHERIGAEMAEKILRKFGFAREEREIVVRAIRNHMRFASVREMRRSKLEALLGERNFPLELELHRLDCIASHGRMECFDFLLEALLRLPPPEPEALVNGRELMDLGFKPGRLLGETLREIRRLQLGGGISTKAQALAYAEKKRGTA